MASEGFSKSGRQNSVKGFTYEISSEQGVFSFSADAGENTNVWFKKYDSDSFIESEESEYGSSWSWMGVPGASQSPSYGQRNVYQGGVVAAHTMPTTYNFKISQPFFGAINGTFDGQYLWINNGSAKILYRIKRSTGESVDFIQFSHATGPLAWDGTYINMMMSGANDAIVYRFEPGDSSANEFFRVSGKNSLAGNGLAWDGSYFWTRAYGTNGADKAYRITTNGNDIFAFSGVDASGTNGMDYDGKYLWYSGEGELFATDKKGNRVHSVSTAANHADPDSAVWDGTYIWSIDNQDGSIYRYEGPSFDISYRVSSVVQ